MNLKNGMSSSSILEEAGSDIQAQCQLNYPNGIKVNEIAVTTAGQIPGTKFIYHLTCPNYSSNSANVLCNFFIYL